MASGLVDIQTLEAEHAQVGGDRSRKERALPQRVPPEHWGQIHLDGSTSPDEPPHARIRDRLAGTVTRGPPRWEWDPRLHDSFPYHDPRELVAERVGDLIRGEFASAGERLRALTLLQTLLWAMVLPQ